MKERVTAQGLKLTRQRAANTMAVLLRLPCLTSAVRDQSHAAGGKALSEISAAEAGQEGGEDAVDAGNRHGRRGCACLTMWSRAKS
jgi:hypothetical protein